MAAVTAGVVAATATVAATAYSASQAGKGGPDSLAEAGYIGPGLAERLFNRGTRDILDAERAILDDAIAQGKQLEPEFYRALGLEPVYDRPEDPEFAAISARLADRQQALTQLRQERIALQGAKGKGIAGQRKRLDRDSKRLRKEIAALSSEVEQRGAVGRRVVGFKPLGGVADPTGSAGNAFGGALDQFNAHLASALAGDAPLDPTLKSAFDEKERTLRERLRRQMGPDYETSTAGAQALANFDRERAEAFAQYNTNAIGYFAGLSESRARTLSDLTVGRMRNLAFPASFRASLAQALGGAAADRGQYVESLRAERTAQGAARARIAEAKASEQAARTEAISNLIGSVGSGLGGATGSLGALGGGGGGITSALAGSSVSPAAGGVGPPTQGLVGVGGQIGGGKIQSLLGGQ